MKSYEIGFEAYFFLLFSQSVAFQMLLYLNVIFIVCILYNVYVFLIFMKIQFSTEQSNRIKVHFKARIELSFRLPKILIQFFCLSCRLCKVQYARCTFYKKKLYLKKTWFSGILWNKCHEEYMYDWIESITISI